MSDIRLRDIITPRTPDNIERADIILLGVPTDQGIIRNGGRPGAALAPEAIRPYLFSLTPNHSPKHKSFADLRIADGGNITGEDLEEQHQKASNAIEEYIRKGKIVIALGGGHDVTYPLAKGFHAGIEKDFSLINIDAHLDVREKKNGLHHSGSSFRLLIEDGDLKGKDFTEFGIQPFSYSKEHYDWAISQGSKVEFFPKSSADFESLISDVKIPLYVSFDIDSIRSSDAPGCSAPSVIGFTSEDAIAICFEAGKLPQTRMLDIVEVSPPFDIDGKTSRLAARMIAAFLAGIANRSSS